MSTDQTRIAIWNSLLDADYYKRYWQLKSNRFATLDRVWQIILAISSSSALLTMLSDFTLDNIWKILTGITALIAVSLPFFNLTKRAIDMAQLSYSWHALEVEYDSLWANYKESNDTKNKYTKIRRKELDIKIYDLPYDDKKIQEYCYRQVLNSRGLE